MRFENSESNVNSIFALMEGETFRDLPHKFVASTIDEISQALDPRRNINAQSAPVGVDDDTGLDHVRRQAAERPARRSRPAAALPGRV